MSSRLSCWLRGHHWGSWDSRRWSNVWGTDFRVRWCQQCGAMDRRGV